MGLDFQRLEQLLAGAAARTDPAQRAAFLAQACGDDGELRAEVERLLAASQQAGDFLETPIAGPVRNAKAGMSEADAQGFGEGSVPAPELREKPGTQIGRYKLLEEIGEGAFGVVYMAEQLAPVQRQVALKIIKAGMDTREVVARFEAERQALALMDHPNIAKILDGGVTGASDSQPSTLNAQLSLGRPYFVMELVRGIPITRFCDQRSLSTSERLQLFIQVCHAVQHAHQKGIIHRDLKPSNILVTLIDGQPVPKVIDFGVAKALGRKLTDKTLFTGFLRMVGTPAYMSPEQADLSGVDIDTRSDIYALGVLLYELLTGVTPFDAETLRHAALDEIQRLIRETDPPKPSTRLHTLVAADVRRLKSSTSRSATQEEVRASSRRLLQIKERIRLVRGDLDWIVMKCLEKNRARRYETANALAQDIQRHLGNEPIAARPPGKIYRLQKLVRRNKLAFAAGTVAALSLIIGLTVATVLFFKERAARRHADEQAAVAQAVNEFLQNDLLRQADGRAQTAAQFKPDANLTVREALERASQRIGQRFKDQPLTELAIRRAIGDGLRGVGYQVQAVPHLLRALELSQARFGPEHLETIKCMDDLAVAYNDAGDPSHAVPLLEAALKLRRLKLGPDHPDTLMTLYNLGQACEWAGKLDRSASLFEETLKLRKARLGPNHPETLRTMAALGESYAYAAKFELSLPLFEQTLKLRRATLGPDHPDTLGSVNNLAAAYRDAGRLDEALPLWEDNFQRQLAMMGPDHPETLATKHNLGQAYVEVGDVDKGLSTLEEVMKVRRVVEDSSHPFILFTMRGLIVAYQAAGRLDEALRLAEEAVQLARDKLGPDHFVTLRLIGLRACAYQQAGRLDQALSLHVEAASLAKASLGPNNPHTLQALNNLGSAYLEAGRMGEALPLLDEALKSRQAKLGAQHPDTLITQAILSQCLLRQGEFTCAVALALECLQLRQKTTPNHWRTFAVQTTVGIALLGQKKCAEAEPFLLQGYRGLKERERTIPATSRRELQEAVQALVQLYDVWGKPDEAARWKRELALIPPPPAASTIIPTTPPR